MVSSRTGGLWQHFDLWLLSNQERRVNIVCRNIMGIIGTLNSPPKKILTVDMCDANKKPICQ